MFPWMMPGAGAGNLSLLSLMMGGGLNGTLSGGGGSASFTSNPQAWARMFSPQSLSDDRSDQTPRGNQTDAGNSMAPPGQQPQGGPDNAGMSPYDANTVTPSPASGYGYEPSPWMRLLGGMRSPSSQQQRAGMNMGLLGMSMLQPRQQQAPRPYPWI